MWRRESKGIKRGNVICLNLLGRMDKYIIIVAGGKGLRMGSEVPKQFIPIGGRPVLMRTIETFYTYDPAMHIILVLPASEKAYWKDLCNAYSFSIPCQLALGGSTRFESVKNGLALVGDKGYVGVHDGVRPFVSPQVIRSCYEEAQNKGAVVPVVDMVETLRHLSKEGHSKTVDREVYKVVQTPQVFSAALLKKAYSQEYSSEFTDDASVMESIGIPVFLVKGNVENIKITTPFDLKVAEAFLNV